MLVTDWSFQFKLLPSRAKSVLNIDWIRQKSVWEIDSLNPGCSLLLQLLQVKRLQQSLKRLPVTRGRSAVGKLDYSTFSNELKLDLCCHNSISLHNWKVRKGGDFNHTPYWTLFHCLSDMFYNCFIASQQQWRPTEMEKGCCLQLFVPKIPIWQYVIKHWIWY